jgi:hypothetical protein
MSSASIVDVPQFTDRTSAACLSLPGAVPIVSVTATPPSEHNTSPALEGTTYSSAAGGQIAPPCTKQVAK